MKKHNWTLNLLLVLAFAILPALAGATDQRILYSERMVGANHPTYADTLNRLSLIGHNNDGTHKAYVDVKEFGAKGDGATNDTTALQGAINYAATNKLTTVIFPPGHYKFTRLYLHYDAVNNPGWPQTAGLQGKLKLTGAGAASGYNFLYSAWTGTVLESTDATGPAIRMDGSGVGSRMSNFTIEDMSIVATNTTYVFDIDIANYNFNMERLLIGQKGSGGGVLYEGGYCVTWSDVLIYGAGKTVSGTGLIIRTDPSQNGGGNLQFINVTTTNFDKGWEIGHNTYASGAIITTINCIGCQASTHKTYGVLIGAGAKNVNWLGSYIEAVQDGANGGIGMVVKNRAQVTSVKGSWFSNNDISLSLGTNDADISTAGIDRATIEDNVFANILVTGIQVWGSLYSYGKEIVGNKFYKSASAPGTTIGIDIQNTVQRGLRVEGNEMDATMTSTITNPARIDLFTKFDTTYGLSSQKRGNFVSFTSLDATPSVASGSLFKTANAGATTITMLDDGFTGQEVLILFNDANTTVDFTGTNLKGNNGVDFIATTGDHMTCIFDGTYWYCAASRIVYAAPIVFSDADVTPSVKNGNDFKTANTGATTITNFDDGVIGQEIEIRFGDGSTAVQNNANVELQYNRDWTAIQAGDKLRLKKWTSTLWVEMSRSYKSDSPSKKGSTASRPTYGAFPVPEPYFDTTLAPNGKPVWWNGTNWVDATGTIS